jgi:hypothetical protein
MQVVADRDHPDASLTRPVSGLGKIPSGIIEGVFDGNVRYLKVDTFLQNQPSGRIRSWTSHTTGNGSLVLDLRDNFGEDLNSALDVADSLIPKGNLIAEVVWRSTGDLVQYRSRRDSADGTNRLVVLVNERTAGTAELLACAIHQSGRGLLIGTKTSGVDEFFTRHRLSDGSVLKVSAGRFYCPNGRSIRWEGQEVDLEISQVSSHQDGRPQFGAGDFAFVPGSSGVDMALSTDRQLRVAIGVAKCLGATDDLRYDALGRSRSKVVSALLDSCQRNRS